jgi:ribokinase
MIHVIGNATIDTVIQVDHLPDPGETVVAKGADDGIGGKGLNQAIVIARTGLTVRLVAAIGNDSQGARIRDSLQAEGVGVDGLWTWPGPTDRCVISVDRQGENSIVSLIGAAQAFDPLGVTPVAEWIGSGDHVVFQGNLRPGVLRACLELAKRRAAITVLNPSPISAPADYDWARVDVAVMNRGEAQVLSGQTLPDDAARHLLQAGAAAVVISLGDRGAVLYAGDDRVAAAPPRVTAVDTTGAGDVLCGALVAARCLGLAWPAALAVAVEASAISVTRPGVVASFPSRQELAHLFAGTAAARVARKGTGR